MSPDVQNLKVGIEKMFLAAGLSVVVAERAGAIHLTAARQRDSASFSRSFAVPSSNGELSEELRTWVGEIV